MLSIITPKLLAAMANVPSGAMIMVMVMYALLMMICCRPIGALMWNARFMVCHVGMKLPLSMLRRSSLERVQSTYMAIEATMVSADAVPMAAPMTDSPAPGMNSSTPSTSTVRDGNIRKKLNTTLRAIIVTLSMLGTTMFPLLRSMPEASIDS